MKRLMLLAVVMLFNTDCATNTCNEKKMGESTSPDRRFTAVLFLRNCGATTPFMQHINLIQGSSSQFSAGHIGAIEDGQVFLTSTGALSMAWENQKTLVVRCEGCLPNCCDKSWVKSWKDIEVLYKPDESIPSIK